jgi:glycosyltransferase involved in cell wall biosynthesis
MKTPAYSLIIPVYNRPQELDELLSCIQTQEFRDFEVVVIEDGSTDDAAGVVEKYKDAFPLAYFVKENGGQGFARNYAFERAKGDYFIILDSDALLEPSYLSEVDKAVKEQELDLFGGPDQDHPSFTPIQKAISYSMTSFFTTGGIRGKEKNIGGQFHPRSSIWESPGKYTKRQEVLKSLVWVKILNLVFAVSHLGLSLDSFPKPSSTTNVERILDNSINNCISLAEQELISVASFQKN